jgi:hypothetical protein
VKNGILINTPQAVTINLYTAPTGSGTLFWTTANTNVPFNSGIYNYDLGPLDPSVFAGNDSIYLESIIAGETLLPRTTVQSTAYALQAGGLEHNGASVSLNAAGGVVISANMWITNGLTIGMETTANAVSGTLRWNSPNVEIYDGNQWQ